MGPDTGRQSKVARLIQTYDLSPLGAELETAWLGTGEQRQSLRDLADRFNRTLVRAAIQDADMDIVDGEPANYYRLLTAEDVSPDTRATVQARLERHGVDVDTLSEEFVSYQAIRHYLTAVRGVNYEGRDIDIDRERTVLNRLQSRVDTVVRDTVDRLRTAGQLSVGEYRVSVDITVLCTDCGTEFTVGDLLGRGRCYCTSPTDTE